MTAATTIARALVAVMLFCAGLWGCVEGIAHAVAFVGPVPVALLATAVVTAIVTFAVTRRLMPPP